MSALRSWWQAARPLAQVNIALPLVVGQALAIAGGAAFHPIACVLVHLFGVFDHLFIVFANDVADEAGDRLSTTHTAFSGGSRVLPDGRLEAAALVRAASAMALGMVVVSATLAFAFDRTPMLLGCGAAIALLLAYSFAPLRLSYRGFGELAQALGTGAVLPAVGYVAHAGDLTGLHVAALVPLVVLGAASNINTALPDAPADREVDKRTWPVRVGLPHARKHSMLAIALGVLTTPLLLPAASQSWLAACEVPSLVVLGINALQWRSADPHDRGACTRFVFLNGLAINLAMVMWTIALLRS
jgi:1,4-dihydroxy-2-naphthoate polyprenyltransferase